MYWSLVQLGMEALVTGFAFGFAEPTAAPVLGLKENGTLEAEACNSTLIKSSATLHSPLLKALISAVPQESYFHKQ